MIENQISSNFRDLLRQSALIAIQAALALNLLIATGAAQESKETGSNSFSDREIEFFENKVRPLLSEHCLQCHGANDKKDSRRFTVNLAS